MSRDHLRRRDGAAIGDVLRHAALAVGVANVYRKREHADQRGHHQRGDHGDHAALFMMEPHGERTEGVGETLRGSPHVPVYNAGSRPDVMEWDKGPPTGLGSSAALAVLPLNVRKLGCNG